MEYSDKALVFLTSHGMDPYGLDMESAVSRFLAEMELGLAGHQSSLDMIPTYLSGARSLPSQAKAAVIDAGGTNFRTALVSFSDGGAAVERMERAPMPGTLAPSTWEAFIDYAAQSLLPFLPQADAVGFCFSYRTEITPARDGRVIALSKQVELSGCGGRLVCADLQARLEAMGAPKRPAVLVNDTAAVLLSGAQLLRGGEYDGLIGLVCGTGENTCCELDTGRIGKLNCPGGKRMLVNLESGGFSGMPAGDFDRELDAATYNPGDHLLEKMCSGGYVGELCRLTLRGAADDGLFSSAARDAVLGLGALGSPQADELAAGLACPLLPLEGEDRQLAAQLCRAVFHRAAKCVAANLAAILILTDSGVEKPACICADGSLFTKSRVFRALLEAEMDAFALAKLGRRARFFSFDHAPVIGSAAAALLNRNE